MENKFELQYKEFKEKQQSELVVVNALKKVYKDFIPSNCECTANLMFGKTFLLDDEEAYVKFLEQAESFEGSILKQIYGVQYFVDQYFGIGRNEEKRRALNNSLDDNHSIKEYKGKVWKRIKIY